MDIIIANVAHNVKKIFFIINHYNRIYIKIIEYIYNHFG